MSALAKSRSKASARLEAYRDWLIIALVNNSTLGTLALLHKGSLLAIPATAVLSVGLAMGGLTILHHAGHARFSRSYPVNMLVVQLAAPIGFWVAHWGMKHRVHHRLPAVYPEDSFTKIAALRLHPSAPRRPWHRCQHYYAWFIYCLAWPGDIGSQLRFLATGRIPGDDRRFRFGWRAATFIAEKIIAISILGLYIVLARSTGLILTSLGTAAIFGGLFAACVVVVGHINLGLHYRPATMVAADWTNHVIETTASFRVASKFVGWLVGGMTLHVAHHLRPTASRGELRDAYRILALGREVPGSTPLIEFDTLRSALRGHRLTLKSLGKSATPDPPPDCSVTADATMPGVSITG